MMMRQHAQHVPRTRNNVRVIPGPMYNTGVVALLLLLFLCHHASGQDDYSAVGGGAGGGEEEEVAPPPEYARCKGVIVAYTFIERTRLFPYIKNVTGQAWAFTAQALVLNTGTEDIKDWKMYIGFKNREILVSIDGAVLDEGGDFPVDASNGTILSGGENTNLLTSIETAGDAKQIQAKVDIKGTSFGLKPPRFPMPRTIRLENDGYRCPAPTRKKGSQTMYACCKLDPKKKKKIKKPKKLKKIKYSKRRPADLSIVYDVMKSYEGKYTAQVTIDNLHPLGRLDNWNLTWDWQRGEFINSMRGAYTYKRDVSVCLYSKAAVFYAGIDFSTVMNCEKSPLITDLPPEKKNDDVYGKLPYCCKDGAVLPYVINKTESRSIFQMEVFKIPPELNRTAFTPPKNWRINGNINPTYRCANPVRVDPSVFPDSSGLNAVYYAIATWQVVCKIVPPKPKRNRCCVSYTAFFSDYAVPCPTCACGCDEDANCNENARALVVPPETLLLPFANRTKKINSFYRQKKLKMPRVRPCPDNCGVSINWHVESDYKMGWTARITLFNWGTKPYKDWFTAVQLNRAYPGFERSFSMNGTKLKGSKKVKNTIFFKGLEGLTYLIAETNGTTKKSPRVPGKMQTVVAFNKKNLRKINIAGGDGFPTKFYFNGEQCALPKQLPRKKKKRGSSNGHVIGPVSFLTVLVVGVVTFLIMS